MARNKRETRLSFYPNTPSTGASAPFQYNSIARPPTGYSANPSVHSALSPPPPLPTRNAAIPDPTRPPHVRQTSVDGLLAASSHNDGDEDEVDNGADTALYARSDWTKGEEPTPRMSAQRRDTAYSESEYPLTTALPTQGDGRHTPVYAQSEWESQYGGMGTPAVREDGQDRRSQGVGMEDVVEEPLNTAWSKSSYAPRGTVLDTVYEEPMPTHDGQEQAYQGYYDDIEPHPDARSPPSQPGQNRRSTLSSAVDISERTNPFDQLPPPSAPASVSTDKGFQRRGSSIRTSTPKTGGGRGPGALVQDAIFTPNAHQKLGRMSVAPARYTLPPGHARRPSGTSDEGSTPRTGESNCNPYAPPGGLRFQQSRTLPLAREKTGLKGLSLTPLRPDDMLSRMKLTKTGQLYMTYRPFLTPLVLMMSAMVLTLAMQGGETLGTFVKVQQGGFGGKVGEGTSGTIGLGAEGWCQLETDDSSIQHTLDYLLATLTALTWLLAVFHLTIAFLHFFLLFGLSIPWDFFITSDPLPPLTGVPSSRSRDQAAVPVSLSEHEVVQKEVDMRVRCERPPYDAYAWVWWAWWGHRRGPVGHVFAVAVGALCVCATGVSARFYLQVMKAVADEKASIAAGTLVPVIAFILALDPIVSAIRYLFHARYNFDAFNNPPSPTPAAVLLPPNARPMRHVRKTGAASYFANQEDPLRVDTIFAADPLAPPVRPLTAFTARTARSQIDPETVRWLAAYPLDPDLESLISDLRAGEESDDFVLSDVGLLYLRPDPAVEGGDALLVPPAGEIRDELLKDAHLEVLESGNEGGSAHWGPETMLAKLSETFWWPGMEEDCRDLVEACARCRHDGLDVEVEAYEEVELKPGMTPLPFTGMKTDGGMTAAMTNPGASAAAADMAFAMRKAQDEARRNELER